VRQTESLASVCTDYTEEAAELSASGTLSLIITAMYSDVKLTVGPCGRVIPHGRHAGAKCERYQMHGIVGQWTLGRTCWLL